MEKVSENKKQAEGEKASGRTAIKSSPAFQGGRFPKGGALWSPPQRRNSSQDYAAKSGKAEKERLLKKVRQI